MNWMNVRYFTPKEFQCSCCGEENMDPEFITLLDEMRHRVGRPLTITSGYRCAEHPDEKRKSMPGAHSAGLAADIAVSNGKERYEILKAAFDLGMVGIGTAKTFIHVDAGHPSPDMRPSAWKYD